MSEWVQMNDGPHPMWEMRVGPLKARVWQGGGMWRWEVRAGSTLRGIVTFLHGGDPDRVEAMRDARLAAKGIGIRVLEDAKRPQPEEVGL